jgi:hypothetical protein
MPALLLRHKRAIILALLALLIVGLKTAYQIHLDFNVADEGFLWYGMQRVFHGEVPLRDYMSYDPGRYYWGAAFMAILGSKGIIAMRIGDAACEALGLFLALRLIARFYDRKGWFALLIAALALSLWMFPRFKVYDHASSIALILSFAYLVEAPSSRRYFFAGVVLGVAAFMGRNHGVYGLAGMGLTVLYLNMKDRAVPIGKAFTSWFGGLLAGYSPMILMMVFIPGVAAASLENIRSIMQNGTNLPMPVPWPWTDTLPRGMPLQIVLGNRLLGVYFVALPAVGVLLLIYVFRKRWQGVPVTSELVACAVLMLPYAHYAFSRAESNHLAFGGFPLFFAMLIGARRFGTWGQTFAAAALLGSGYLFLCYQLPGFNSKVPMKIGGADLTVTPLIATDVGILNRLEAKYASHGESFLVTPVWPSAYPMFERKSPIWDLYSLFPRDMETQEKEIAEIQKANLAFILVIDEPPDKNGALLFRNTNPHLMTYIRSHYDETNDVPENPHLHVYIPRGPQP